ncbi:MAG: methionine synthase [Candidatus Tectomicrobia bacterium]|uniref:Methionine synthase n=1 Tax=Tectimicrobiota bacterium TaxID=2528274 RepID=A0A938B3U9_UNCTE|nr:methionine synthase [Candidatus Tectomicrobia bacterium]
MDIHEILRERILVLDGAMGTLLQNYALTADDFGGLRYEGCNEYINLTRPDVVQAIYTAYLEAGADILLTNTFGGTRIVLAEYDLQDQVQAINVASARLACEAARAHSTLAKPRFVAGSLGPQTKTISVTGGITFDEVMAAFYEQVLGLLEGGVDLLLIETAQDTLNLKATMLGAQRAMRETGITVPVMISGTIEVMGTMLGGQSIEALYTSVAHFQPLSIGLNCSTGPEFMTDHLRSLAALSAFPVSCHPNAGLPDEEGHYHETPSSLAAQLERFVDNGWLNIVGGCCGTTPEHIKVLADMVQHKRPRQPVGTVQAAVSGLDYLPLEVDSRPLIVGERTNVIGSKRFRDLISEGQYESAAEVGRAQVKGGAQVIDICLANPDRDEYQDMERFLAFVAGKVRVPLMIDSTDARVLELALKHSQGKAIVNSINLEDGEERFAAVVPLLRTYGAAVVVGCIDEDKVQGMGVTRERKLAIAQRSYDLLVEKYGIPPEDIIFDPLVFPVGTGDENYIGSAAETIAGLHLIKQALPRSRTILGISNVSFGLPNAGREVLNAVFLYHCTQAGLDYAIVNAQRLERYASIPEEERRLCEDLLFWRSNDPVGAFSAFYRGRKATAKKPQVTLPLEQRLAAYIIEGTKDGLFDDLDMALQRSTPLEIINGPLMDGMTEVGRLFNSNELIVAEVLLSAESMKAAVGYLEPHMEKTDSALKGKMLLATVKGDVHDIGKNLVDIVLTNNGFEVVNLGIKVPPQQLIEACREEQPDYLGLSGLLVKSAQQMVVTAQDLSAAGISIPLLVGGAALSNRFTATKIAPEYDGPVLYAKDAMHGLDLANQLSQPHPREQLIMRVRSEQHTLRRNAEAVAVAATPAPAGPPRTSALRRDVPLPTVPDWQRHVLRDISLESLWPYVNAQMLYGKHMGLRGNVHTLFERGDPKALDIKARVDDLFHEAVATRLLHAHGMYRFFPAQADGDTIMIYDPQDHARVLERFTFPRQPGGKNLCLADFVRPAGTNEMDAVALFVVTCGLGVRTLAATYKDAGSYVRSHAIQALAIELAEAYAEQLHQHIRTAWGFPDPPELTMRARLQAQYRGLRVSFGYPACPELEDQAKLFALLQPEEIGVQLTDGYMMDPEASVSALVFHHPEAEYFRADRA